MADETDLILAHAIKVGGTDVDWTLAKNADKEDETYWTLAKVYVEEETDWLVAIEVTKMKWIGRSPNG